MNFLIGAGVTALVLLILIIIDVALEMRKVVNEEEDDGY